jgi:hypothetical protein
VFSDERGTPGGCVLRFLSPVSGPFSRFVLECQLVSHLLGWLVSQLVSWLVGHLVDE